MSRTLKFTKTVAQELRASEFSFSNRGDYLATGRLDVGPVIVGVTFVIPPRFKTFKRTPPLAFCHAPWMKKGLDWHNGPPLCWVLPEHWRDVMNWNQKPVSSILDEGRRWLLDGVKCLISRHYVAHLEGLAEWQEEWESWSHFGEGVKEYKRARRQRLFR